MHLIKVALILAAVAATAYSQALDCTLGPTVVPSVRTEGEAEPVGEVLVVCSGGTPSASTPINITLTLNTNITSLTLGTGAVRSEALLLIDDPTPDAVNTSNGFSYNGQVLGTPYVAAGAHGSGNVYLAEQSTPASVTWSGVPFVAPGPSGTRTLRLTNIRANATALPVVSGLSPVLASVSATIPIGNSSSIYVAFAAQGLAFSASVPGPGTANLTFTEGLPGAFRERIVPATGPFTMARQDLPGYVYYSESQFTPCFTFGNCSSPPAGSIGLATTGTLLLARMTRLGATAASVSAPNQVLSETGFLTAYLMVGGQPVLAVGNSSLPITGGSVNILYEVTGSIAFALDAFTIPAALFDSSGAPLAYPAHAVFSGYLAPVNSTPTASSTAPRPRFAP
jgi:hypothetical protein